MAELEGHQKFCNSFYTIASAYISRVSMKMSVLCHPKIKRFEVKFTMGDLGGGRAGGAEEAGRGGGVAAEGENNTFVHTIPSCVRSPGSRRMPAS